jgi:hypothetical protein
MKKFGMFLLLGVGGAVWAAPELKVTSLSNAARSTLLEVCGEVKDSESPAKVYLVRIEHGGGNYQSVTGIDGQFCTFIKRRTFDGEIKASVVAPLLLEQ